MKKTRIAVGVIVALGVICTASAWYTGKQLEKNRVKLVQRANDQLHAFAPGSGLHVTLRDYQRGIFSSHTRIVVQSASQTEDTGSLKPGQTIEFKENISHGPFPLAQLKKFNLLPALASFHTEMLPTDVAKKLFDLTKGQSAFQAETRLGYGGATDSVIRFLPISWQDAQTNDRIAFDGGTLDVSADKHGDKMKVKAGIGNLLLAVKNQLGVPVQFTINGLTLDADSHLSAESLRVGEQKMAINSVTASMNNKEIVKAEGLDANSTFDSKGELISGNIAYQLNRLALQGQDLGQSKLTLNLTDFEAAAIKAFTTSYNQQIQALASDSQLQNDPDLYQSRLNDILLSNLPLLMKGHPGISITPFSWKNSRGESSLNLAVRFNDPSFATSNAPSPVSDIERMLQSVDGKLAVSIPMATQLMTQLALVEGHPQDEATRLAEQQVKGLSAMGQMFKLTTEKDNAIQASLQYGAGEVTFNGEKQPLDRFLSRFFLGGEPQPDR